MFSRHCYILVGNNNTGKTTFQREMVAYLCNQHYKRLPTNTHFPIVNPKAPKGMETLFTANRSFQEKIRIYRSVRNYFDKHFSIADVVVLASHSDGESHRHIEDMIAELQERCYNVSAVFWSNDYGSDTRGIARLGWHERFWIDNPIRRKEADIPWHLSRIAKNFSDMLMERARTW